MSPEMVRRRELARARAVAARERVRTLRRQAAVGTASVFAAAWVGVFGQPVSGQDPALGSGTTRTSKTAEPTVRTTSAVAPARPAVAATPLTTRQS